MSEQNINVYITDEETVAFTITEEQPINITVDGYTVLAGGVTELDDLADVTITGSNINDMLIHNGSKYINQEVLKYIDSDNEFEVNIF